MTKIIHTIGSTLECLWNQCMYAFRKQIMSKYYFWYMDDDMANTKGFKLAKLIH